MIIFPAIDIKDGKVVRLTQGRFDNITEYADDPAQVAQQWVSQGANWLHVVDLNGALDGKLVNLETILSIVRSVKIPVQVGGGIRTQTDIDKLLAGGVQRIILGTRAIDDKNFLKDNLKKAKTRIAVSLDCSGGMVAQRGWTTVLKLKATELAKELENYGLQCLIYTDIARDGMLTGPNFEGIKEMLNTVKIPVIASGGISSLEDIRQLVKLKKKNLEGIITGKALYEGKLNLKDAIQLCSQKE